MSDTESDVVREGSDDATPVTNPVAELLGRHFGTNAIDLPVVGDEYLPLLDVHLQSAVEAFVAADGRTSELYGVSIPNRPMSWIVPMALLLSDAAQEPPSLSAPDYSQQDVSDGRRTVLRRGLFVTRDADGPAALWVSKGYGMCVEVMAPTRERAEAIISELRDLTYVLNPFKGQVITITTDCPGNILPVYLERPREVSADEVVLPQGLLERIEKQAFGISEARDALLDSGHNLKRGILLYGRPGTGKTHTIRYLISKMRDHTVLTMPASRMQLFTGRLPEVVPYITPGILIFDDVDLIAEDRSEWFTNDDRGPLFSLLELMDGLASEADLLFVLTTNVVGRLEEAIVARPGRIDQAFEIPPPDAACRARLFEVYAKDVDTDISDLDAIIERTEGVTGSFLKELVRRATVHAMLDDDDSDDDDEVTLTDAHLHRALDELLDPENAMTAQLLGARAEAPMPSINQVEKALRRG